MIEETSNSVSAATAMGTVALASILPGVNGDALIGAFAGAVVFALHSKDISMPERIIYMIVSILLGYSGAGEVMRHTGLQSHTLAAFGLSAVVVTIALASIDKIRAFDIDSLLKKRR